MVRHFVLGPASPGGRCEMTEVAVTQALGESLSPQPGNRVSHLSCRVVLSLSGRTEQPATGALTLGKAFQATPARNFRQMITGGDVAAGEAFNKERLVAVPQAALLDDEDAASLPTPRKLLYRRKPRESRTWLHRKDD